MSRLKFETAVAIQGGAMETETISKNRLSLKSQMSRGNFKLFSILFLFASIFVFSSCKKEKEDDNTELPEYFLIENFGNCIDYAILGVDGTGYFLEAYDENQNIPKRLSIYNGNNIELVINFDVEGLPKNIVSEDFTVVLGNYISNKFSAIVITKEGKREMFENIETDIFWDEYKNSLKSGGIFHASSSMIVTKGFWSDFGKGLVKGALLGVTTVGCVVSTLTAETVVSAGLAVISCGSVAQQFGEITGLYELPSIIPEGISLLGDAFGTGINCLKAGANPVGLATFECLQGFAGVVLTVVDNLLSAKEDAIDLGEGILNIVGVWKGWYSAGTVTLTIDNDMTGVFDFFNGCAGSYKVSVKYSNGAYNITGTSWINRPTCGFFWTFANLNGGVINNGILSGKDSSGGDFQLEKVR